MTNADLLEETYATALGAEGSAEKELENYQQGVQYSIDKFKASWEELSNTILSSDLLKGIVDFGSGFLQTINDIVSSVGGLQTALAAVAGIGLVKGLKSGNIQSFLGLGDATKQATQFSAQMTSGMGNATQATTGLNAIIAKTGMSIGDLVSVAGGIAGVAATIYFVYEYATRFDRAIETAEESLAQFQSDQADLDSLTSQTDDIKTQLQSLADTYEINIDGMDDVDSMIDKIESSADTTLSITDKATLEDLRAQNAELERQIILQEQVVEASQSQALADAQKVLSMNATTDLTTARTMGDIYGFGLEQTVYDNADIITATQNEINYLEKLKDARQKDVEATKTATGEKLDSINEEIAGYDYEIQTYENAISTQLESLNSIKEALAGTEEYDIISDLQDQFNDIDLSPLEKQISSLDKYFSTNGMDYIKNAIMDAVEAGETASDVFERMGLSLDSIGDNIDAGTFNDYFNSLVSSAEEAENAIDSVEGTLASMQAAADTANQNANWESAASLLADAQELYENGLIGTDDFKEAAQYMSPETLLPKEGDYKYDANAYVEAWENAQSKVKRYFDSENPAQSMINALDDLTAAGLATNQGEGIYDWTEDFTNSAQAADALGISIAAAEDILHGLEAYGSDLGDLFFSGAGLEEYENYLEGIRSIYDSMAEGDTKTRMGEILDDFDTAKDGFEEDISQLDNEAIVHIKFEYDLAQLQADVENARQTDINVGGSVSTRGDVLNAQQTELAYLKNATGLTTDGVEVPVKISNIDEQITKLQADLANATSDEEKLQIQAEIENLQDVEANLLEAFGESEYAVNIDGDSSVADIEAAWDGFLSSVEGKDLIANISADSTEAIKAISDITGLSEQQVTAMIVVDASQATATIDGVVASLGRADGTHVITMDVNANTDQVEAQISALEAGDTIVFMADVSGIETAVQGVKDQEGEITYYVSADTNLSDAESALSSLTGGDVNVEVRADTGEAQSAIDNISDKSITVSTEADLSEVESALSDSYEGTINFTANVDGVSSTVSACKDETGTVTYTANIDGISTSVSSIKNEDGTVTFTANTSEPEGYSPSDKDGTVIFGVDSSAPDGYQPSDKSATVKYNPDTSSLPTTFSTVYRQVVYQATGATQFNGTAHANGTATTLPRLSGAAKANGDVDEWSAEVSKNWITKKGETALTGEIGRELVVDTKNNRWYTVGDNGAEFNYIPAGSIVFNHEQTEDLLKTGSTDGTAHAQGTAFVSGGVQIKTSSSSSSSKSSSSSSSSKSSSSSSSKKSSSSSSSKKSSSKSSSSSASSAIDELFDFIEIYLNRASRVTQLAIDAIDDAVSLSDKLSKNSTALTKIQSEITKNQQAADAYLAQANSVGLSSSYVTKIQNGSLDVSTITSQDTLDKINEYQEYYEKYLDCLDEAVSLQRELNDLAQERLDYIEESYDLVTKVHESLQQVNQSALDYNEAMGYSAISDSVKKAIQSSIDEAEEIYKVAQEELSQYQSEFNSLVKNGYIKEGSDAYNEATAKINELTAAVDDAAVAVIDFQDQLRQIDYTKLQNVIDGLDRVTSKLDAWIDLQEARDETIDESVYQQMLDYNNEQIANNMSLRSQYLKEQALYDVNSTKYQELADTIEKLDEETLKLMQDNEELKDSIFELRFSALEEAIDGYEDLRDEISDFYKLLNEDSFFDKNGSITSNGLAGISLIAEQIGIAKQEVADYTEGMNKLKESFDNGVISEVEYNEKMEEYRKGLQGAILDIKDLTDEISDLYVTQVKKEIDALKEVINKRKEALQAKADYYEYDKKISSQTKDINSLQAQIAALEGANSASAQAQLKNLQAQLAEAQEELEDTKYQHSVDIQVAGYDSMSDELDDFLDDLEYSMSQSMETQLEIVESYLDKIVASYEDAYGVINDIVTSTGWIGSEGFTSSQSSLSTSSGASSIVSSATSSQSDVSSSSAASGTVTSAIDNNDSKNAEYESQIMTEEDTSNRQVAELTVSPSSVSVVAGKSTSISTSIRPTDAANQKLSWSSSNTSVATVSSSGKITGVKAGSCKVTVSTTDGSGISKTVSVTVTAPATTTSTTTTTTSSTKTTTSQGNGIPEVGDKVTFNSGRYYYDSYGSSPSGSKYQGKTVYITKVHNDSRPKPIHISTGSKLGSGDLGWLTKSQISGYAKGTKFVPDDQWSQINEQGREILVTNSGQILSYLQRGDAVIPNELTENLYDWGAMNPSEFLKNGNGEAPVVSSVGEVNKSVDVVFNYDNLVNIEGKADANTVDELRKAIPKLGKELTDVVTGNLTREGRKLGLR